MAQRCGITTDLARRKGEHEATYKNVRDWKSTSAFPSREAAQKWEDGHDASWEKHGGGADADGKWYGYEFKHDGKK